MADSNPKESNISEEEREKGFRSPALSVIQEAFSEDASEYGRSERSDSGNIKTSQSIQIGKERKTGIQGEEVSQFDQLDPSSQSHVSNLAFPKLLCNPKSRIVNPLFKGFEDSTDQSTLKYNSRTTSKKDLAEATKSDPEAQHDRLRTESIQTQSEAYKVWENMSAADFLRKKGKRPSQARRSSQTSSDAGSGEYSTESLRSPKSSNHLSNSSQAQSLTSREEIELTTLSDLKANPKFESFENEETAKRRSSVRFSLGNDYSSHRTSDPGTELSFPKQRLMRKSIAEENPVQSGRNRMNFREWLEEVQALRQDIEDENLEETLEDALTMNATSDFKRSRLHIDREMKRAGIMSLEELDRTMHETSSIPHGVSTKFSSRRGIMENQLVQDVREFRRRLANNEVSKETLGEKTPKQYCIHLAAKCIGRAWRKRWVNFFRLTSLEANKSNESNAEVSEKNEPIRPPRYSQSPREMSRIAHQVDKIISSVMYHSFIRFIAILHMCLVLVEPSSTFAVRDDSCDFHEPQWILQTEAAFVSVYILAILLKLFARGKRGLGISLGSGSASTGSTKRKTWPFVNLCIVFLMAVEVGFKMWFNIEGYRFTRPLRAIILVAQTRRLRYIVTAVLKTIPNVMPTFSLMALLLIVYSMLGYRIFRGQYPEEDFPQSFDTPFSSIVSMFVLLTTENYPSIMNPAVELSPFYTLFFVPFLIIGTGLMVVLLGVVCDTHQQSVVVQAFHNLSKERTVMRAAFALIAECPRGLGCHSVPCSHGDGILSGENWVDLCLAFEDQNRKSILYKVFERHTEGIPHDEYPLYFSKIFLSVVQHQSHKPDIPSTKTSQDSQYSSSQSTARQSVDDWSKGVGLVDFFMLCDRMRAKMDAPREKPASKARKLWVNLVQAVVNHALHRSSITSQNSQTNAVVPTPTNRKGRYHKRDVSNIRTRKTHGATGKAKMLDLFDAEFSALKFEFLREFGKMRLTERAEMRDQMFETLDRIDDIGNWSEVDLSPLSEICETSLAEKIVISPIMVLVIRICIAIQALSIIFVEPAPPVNGWHIFDMVVVVGYIIEALVKISVLGRAYWSIWWNIFDFFIGIISSLAWVGMIVPQDIANIRLFQALHVVVYGRVLHEGMRILKSNRFGSYQKFVAIKTVAIQVTHLVLSMTLVLIVFAYSYAILGMELFSCSKMQEAPDYEYIGSDFDNFLHSFAALFQLTSTSDWHEIMYAVIDVTSLWSSIYFIVFYIIVLMIFINLLCALVVDSLAEISDAQAVFDYEHGFSTQRAIQDSIKSRMPRNSKFFGSSLVDQVLEKIKSGTTRLRKSSASLISRQSRSSSLLSRGTRSASRSHTDDIEQDMGIANRSETNADPLNPHDFFGALGSLRTVGEEDEIDECDHTGDHLESKCRFTESQSTHAHVNRTVSTRSGTSRASKVSTKPHGPFSTRTQSVFSDASVMSDNSGLDSWLNDKDSTQDVIAPEDSALKAYQPKTEITDNREIHSISSVPAVKRDASIPRGASEPSVGAKQIKSWFSRSSTESRLGASHRKSYRDDPFSSTLVSMTTGEPLQPNDFDAEKEGEGRVHKQISRTKSTAFESNAERSPSEARLTKRTESTRDRTSSSHSYATQGNRDYTLSTHSTSAFSASGEENEPRKRADPKRVSRRRSERIESDRDRYRKGHYIQDSVTGAPFADPNRIQDKTTFNLYARYLL